MAAVQRSTSGLREEDLNIGVDNLDVSNLNQSYPQFETLTLNTYSLADVGKILDKNLIRLIRPVDTNKSILAPIPMH